MIIYRGNIHFWVLNNDHSKLIQISFSFMNSVNIHAALY